MTPQLQRHVGRGDARLQRATELEGGVEESLGFTRLAVGVRGMPSLHELFDNPLGVLDTLRWGRGALAFADDVLLAAVLAVLLADLGSHRNDRNRRGVAPDAHERQCLVARGKTLRFCQLFANRCLQCSAHRCLAEILLQDRLKLFRRLSRTSKLEGHVRRGHSRSKARPKRIRRRKKNARAANGTLFVACPRLHSQQLSQCIGVRSSTYILPQH